MVKGQNVLARWRQVEFNAYCEARNGRPVAVWLTDGEKLEGMALEGENGDFFILTRGGSLLAPHDATVYRVWNGGEWRAASEFTEVGKEWAHLEPDPERCPIGFSRFIWSTDVWE